MTGCAPVAARSDAIPIAKALRESVAGYFGITSIPITPSMPPAIPKGQAAASCLAASVLPLRRLKANHGDCRNGGKTEIHAAAFRCSII